MTTRILGIHGVGNFSERISDADRKHNWLRSLQAGFGDGPVPELEVEVAYYAPALHLGTRQGLRSVEQLTTEEQSDVWAWLLASGLPQEVVAQGGATKPLRQALEWFARHYGLDQKVVEIFIAKFFREVSTYFSPQYAHRRDQAVQVVTSAIDAFEPHIVLAHSLGSVVAYEALWLRPPARIDLLATLGSPLAMPTVVYDRLRPSPLDSPARKPPTVKRWVNVADPGDLISVPRPFSKYFQGVEASLEPTIHYGDFHRSKHYLASPTVAALVLSEAP